MTITLLMSVQNLFAQFSGGDGTASNPYQITTPVHLDSVRYFLDKCFILNNDIDLSVYKSGYSWVAIDKEDGCVGDGFRGKFDGNGKIITGLKIDTNRCWQGLFGYVVHGGVIKNLGVEGVNIVVDGNFVGGLVGLMDGTDGRCAISKCYVTGTVTGNGFVGGLVGFAEEYGAADTILDCYSRAAVTGTSSFGGLIGFASSQDDISNCYCTGIVSEGGGGLIGSVSGAFSGTACFWDTVTSGRSSSAGGAGVVGKTTAQMKTQSTFTDAGWDFTGTWEMIGTNYPRLRIVPDDALPVELTSFTASLGGNSVKLNWQTATEVNNYGFEVEKRKISDELRVASNWEKVGFVMGNGTSNVPHEYSYSDLSLISGRYAYRLKQVDNDGVYKYTASVELEVKMAPATIGLVQNFPNPFNPSTKISFSVSSTEQTRLVVYNLLGQQVMTLFDGIANGQQEYTMNFDASRLACGVYFYKLVTPSRTEVRKMQLLK